MIELAQHIEVLLGETDCVIVPGLGGFVAHYAPSVRVKEQHLFLPPARTIGFNPQLRLNDGTLVQSYMAAHDTNFADASRMIDNAVSSLLDLLHKEGKVTLRNIGTLHYTIYGNYDFSPCDCKVTPALYGLETFEMYELSVLSSSTDVPVPAVQRERRMYALRIARTCARVGVAAIVAIVLFFAFSTPVENTEVRTDGYAGLLPDELFGQIAERSVAVTPVASPAEQTLTKSTVTAQRATTMPATVKDVEVPAQQPAATPSSEANPARSAVNRPFHLIVVGGISRVNAERYAAQLRDKGFAETCVLDADDKIRVSLRSFDNREEATRRLLELRQDEMFHDAWLLELK